MNFKDHFSTQSQAYSKYRPTYPGELFSYLAENSPRKDRVWDCACGTGQGARALAKHFSHVTATDASAAQIGNAQGPENVTYLVRPAENSGLAGTSCDLVTVAQALHWFSCDEFYAEVRRVLKPDGLVAIWSYAVTSVTPQVDAVVHELYEDIIGPYWPQERIHIEEGYKNLPFPFEEITPPHFDMALDWDLDQLLGYFSSWSAVERYKADKGHDPVALVSDRLKNAWGEGRKQVKWPLKLRLGR